MSEPILIVEDSKDLLEVWQTLFKMTTDYDVVGCQTIEKARRVVSEGFQPKVVLTDYYLGDGNGLDLISEFKKALPDTRYVIITGKDLRFIKESNVEAADTCVLQKPVNFKDLCAKVSDYLH